MSLPLPGDSEQGWFNGLLGIVAGLILFIMRLYKSRFERLEKLCENSVSKDDMRHMHEENKRTLNMLTTRIDRVLERLQR